MNLEPTIKPPLDLAFLPATLFNRCYLNHVKTSQKKVPLVIGLEREQGFRSRFETVIKSNTDADTLRYVERIVKFLVWSRGGWKLWIGGPKDIGQQIKLRYGVGGERQFDMRLMSQAYERPFEVAITEPESVPPENESNTPLGGHLDGCRLGFDLGASDYKIAAVQNGAVVYSNEFPWQPKDQVDPRYHYEHVNSALKKAAAHLPHVDAIGGSTAGIVVDNKLMAASLFRSVPPSNIASAKTIFLQLRDEWKVPFAVANDGDVTALAGATLLKENGVLGIAMGSSLAAGYLNRKGCITGWLNELAFAPTDYSTSAASDEWSGDFGVGAMSFSQQAINKLLPAARIDLPAEMDLPERLKHIQTLMARNDPRARRIYETIGVYLGYTIPFYAEFYNFQHLLLLGRVTSGPGGDLIRSTAQEVLKSDFPNLAEKIALHVPDEKNRRVGQAVAAAGLPRFKTS